MSDDFNKQTLQVENVPTPVKVEKIARVTPRAIRTSTALLDSLIYKDFQNDDSLDPLDSDPHAEAVAAALAADAARRAAHLDRKRKRCCSTRLVNDGPSTLKIEFLDETEKIQLTYRRTTPILTHVSRFFNMFQLQGDKDPFFSNYIKKIFNLDSAKLVTNWEEGIYGHIPPPDELTLQEPIVAGCDKSGRSFISVMLCNDRMQKDWGFVQCAKAHDVCLAEHYHALVLFQPFAIDDQDDNKNILKDVWTWRHYIKPKGLKKKIGESWLSTTMFLKPAFSDLGLDNIDFNDHALKHFQCLSVADKRRNYGLRLLSKHFFQDLFSDLTPRLDNDVRRAFRKRVKSLKAKREAREIPCLTMAIMEQAPEIVGADLWQQCIDRQLEKHEQISDWQSYKFVYFGCDKKFHKLKTFLRKILQPEVLRSDHVEVIASLRAKIAALEKAATEMK